MASPDTVLVEITDTRRLVAAVDVPAFYLESVKQGEIANLQLHSASSRPTMLPSKVIFIDPAVDPGSGMASVDLSMPLDAGLRPGQFVQAEIIVGQRDNCLAVPANAIVHGDQGLAWIGLVKPGHQAQLVPVQIGIQDGDMVQITGDGLASGQTIVTTGALRLDQPIGDSCCRRLIVHFGAARHDTIARPICCPQRRAHHFYRRRHRPRRRPTARCIAVRSSRKPISRASSSWPTTASCPPTK